MFRSGAQKALLILVGLLALVPAAPRRANAGFISLAVTDQLAVRQEGEVVRVTGNYEVQNRGDEATNGVFVALQLGRWSHATPAQTLDVYEAANWELDESLPLNELACGESPADLCAGQVLPLRGVFPLRITHHYQDINSFLFSAVDAKRVVVGNLVGEEAKAAQVPELQAGIEMQKAEGQNFTGRLIVRSSAATPRVVSVSLFTAREMGAVTRPFQLRVEPGSEHGADFEVLNHSALEGGSYPLFALLQWQDGEIRNSLIASAQVAVGRESGAARPKLLLAVVLVCAAIALLVVMVRLGATG